MDRLVFANHRGSMSEVEDEQAPVDPRRDLPRARVRVWHWRRCLWPRCQSRKRRCAVVPGVSRSRRSPSIYAAFRTFGDPNWRRAAELGLDTDLLIQALGDASDPIAYTAANLLESGAGGTQTAERLDRAIQR